MHNSSQTIGDWAVRVMPRLNPRWLERYIDTSLTYSRLSAISNANQTPEFALQAVKQYLKEYEIIQSGLNPDNYDNF